MPLFNSIIRSSKRIKINKGQLNKVRLRPHCIGPHVESSRAVQSTVTSSNIVGQIFKNTKDNIHDLSATMSIGGTETAIDDFEGYADSAALQAEWVETNQAAVLEEVIVSPNESSTKSARFSLQVAADEWVNTIAEVDFTGKKFTFDFIQTVGGEAASFDFFIGDGADTKSVNISAEFSQVWSTIEILESDMVNDGATSPDITAITDIGFRVADRGIGEFFYIDNLTHAVGTGSAELKLFDLGTSLPSPAATLDGGTQYTTLGDLGITGIQASSVTVPLNAGINLYHVDGFAAGIAPEIPANALLNIGNYYAFTINYVDVDVDVYGPDASFGVKYYRDGYAFTAANESAAITRIGDGLNHLMFIISFIQDVEVRGIEVRYYDSSGNEVLSDILSSSTIYIEDTNMDIKSAIMLPSNGLGTTALDISSAPESAEAGSKVEIYYSSAPNDAVDSICLCVTWGNGGVEV